MPICPTPSSWGTCLPKPAGFVGEALPTDVWAIARGCRLQPSGDPASGVGDWTLGVPDRWDRPESQACCWSSYITCYFSFPICRMKVIMTCAAGVRLRTGHAVDAQSMTMFIMGEDRAGSRLLCPVSVCPSPGFSTHCLHDSGQASHSASVSLSVPWEWQQNLFAEPS